MTALAVAGKRLGGALDLFSGVMTRIIQDASRIPKRLIALLCDVVDRQRFGLLSGWVTAGNAVATRAPYV
ncbi:hypothetical protein [Mesobacterium pallidum]|uniref:hypothetical protein n=1 Tax=Mesobacterium pallidum TaxID=2872037 RepID=UPI001EE39FE7|nr:hypothetical protein [Mesobacterium pallidum]